MPVQTPRLTSKPLLLSALPTAPSCAREASRLQLAEWGLSALTDTLAVIVSELVTNAVEATAAHGISAQVALRLAVSGARVRVEVWDAAPGAPRPNRQSSPLSETGRGLLLVEELTNGHWGWTRCPGTTKLVWADIPLP